MQATARGLPVVSATSCARRRLIRDVRCRNEANAHNFSTAIAPPCWCDVACSLTYSRSGRRPQTTCTGRCPNATDCASHLPEEAWRTTFHPDPRQFRTCIRQRSPAECLLYRSHSGCCLPDRRVSRSLEASFHFPLSRRQDCGVERRSRRSARKRGRYL